MIKSEIQDGKFKPGQRLLPEDSMAKDFHVSRATIRAALKILENEHYLISKHGSGTFVSENAIFINNAINQLRSTSEMAKASNLEIMNKTISLSIAYSDEVMRDTFNLNETEQIVKLERIGYVEKEPILYSIDIFPLRIAPEMASITSFKGSLLAYMEDKCNIRIKCANATVSAVESIPWPVKTVKRTIPALYFEQMHYDQQDKPVLYSIDYYRSNYFKFHIFRRRDIK